MAQACGSYCDGDVDSFERNFSYKPSNVADIDKI